MSQSVTGALTGREALSDPYTCLCRCSRRTASRRMGHFAVSISIFTTVQQTATWYIVPPSVRELTLPQVQTLKADLPQVTFHPWVLTYHSSDSGENRHECPAKLDLTSLKAGKATNSGSYKESLPSLKNTTTCASDVSRESHTLGKNASAKGASLASVWLPNVDAC